MLTRILVIANVIVFAWMNLTGAYASDNALVAHGALYGPAVAQGEWWRIFTAAFLHGGITHILFNMIALWQVGSIVETLYGSWRMAIIYTLATVGSGIAVVTFNYDIPTVGASGAIFGLFGAMVAAGLRLGAPGRMLVQQTLPIIVINLVIGFTLPNISNAGHLGGLVAGFCIGFIIPTIVRPHVGVSAATPVETENGTYEPPEYVEQLQEPPPHAPVSHE